MDDGLPHRVEMLASGKNFTMRIDKGFARTIVNEGEREFLEVDTPLFLGGLPESVKLSATRQWHVRNGTSFQGCVNKVDFS